MDRTYIHTSMDGSITLFLALILTLVFSFFFSLLEAARVQGLSQIARRGILLKIESAFGEYQTELWKDYHMLFLDGGNYDGELDLALLEGRWMDDAALQKKGAGFFELSLRSLEITEYSLATDQKGAAFEKQACQAIQEQLVSGAAELLKQKLGAGEKIAKEGEELDEKWESAKDAMVQAEDLKEESTNLQEVPEMNPQDPVPDQTNLPDNPIESVDLLKKSAILAVVVENPSEISNKCISLSNTLSHRDISVGNQGVSENGVLDKLWFLQYLDTYFSCKTGVGKLGSSEHALDYELEYCVSGKSSDQENLEKAVHKLLLVREAGNFTTILQDGKKRALAMEIATAAVGFTGIVPLIQAVQIGILLAWSYLESILDVRCLLSGGSVALVKSVTDWKSDVSLGEEGLKQQKEEEGQDEGLNYREYLQLLLLLVQEESLVCRAMDVMEQNIRLKKPAFRMDHQIYGMRLEGLYNARPMFWGLITGVKDKNGMYHFRESYSDSY